MRRVLVLDFLKKNNPLKVILMLRAHRELVMRLLRREIEARYKGSLFGVLWFAINPLVMLAVYSFVFSVVFHARWGTVDESRLDFALLVFSGLLFFNLFSEPVSRSPGLVLEHASYVKKVVFPLEVLPWVSLGVSIFNALVNGVILATAFLAIRGVPDPEALLFPLIALPIIFTALGLTWFLSATGVYLRDTRPLVGVFITVVMFMSPIFYPLSAVPPHFRGILELNPIAVALEESKSVLFFGGAFQWHAFLRSLLVSWVVAWLGLLWFMKTKKGFADVL